MSLQALIDLSKVTHLSAESIQRLQAARQRHREFDQKIEAQVAKKAVGQELLMRACNL